MKILVLTIKMKMMNCGDDCDYDLLWCRLIRDDGIKNHGKNDDDDDDKNLHNWFCDSHIDDADKNNRTYRGGVYRLSYY